MNGMTSCPEFRQLIGVYVVGAIDPHERALVDAHLPSCSGCREELAGLAGLPALLGRVPVDEAARISGIFSERSPAGQEPGGELLTPLLNRMRHQRRVQRWRGLAAAAAAVVAVAGLSAGVTSALSSSGGTAATVHWETVRASDAATHVTAAVKYARMPWGSRIDARVSGVPGGTTCELWVAGANGTWQPVGSWTASWSETGAGTWYQESTSIPAPQVSGFKITAGQHLLVDIPAA